MSFVRKAAFKKAARARRSNKESKSTGMSALSCSLTASKQGILLIGGMLLCPRMVNAQNATTSAESLSDASSSSDMNTSSQIALGAAAVCTAAVIINAYDLWQKYKLTDKLKHSRAALCCSRLFNKNPRHYVTHFNDFTDNQPNPDEIRNPLLKKGTATARIYGTIEDDEAQNRRHWLCR